KVLVSKLVEHIIRKGGDIKQAKNIVGTIYSFPDEPRGTEMRDAREYSSLLNACGRTNSASCGVAIAMGDRGQAYRDVQGILKEYRFEISKSISWIEENKANIVVNKKIVSSFHGGKVIKDSIIGTLASIIISSNLLGDKQILVGMAENEDGSIKASGRTTQEMINRGVDIGKAFKEALEKIDPEGEAGGHSIAAGARMTKGLEKKFINSVDKIFLQQIADDK
ncbi:MAG: DHH family phosphoesterase, partial [Candidatus Ranarchaeia archaeon]